MYPKKALWFMFLNRNYSSIGKLYDPNFVVPLVFPGHLLQRNGGHLVP